MPSLLEALSDGSFDMLTKHDMSSAFSQKLRLYKDVIISEYLKFNIDLNRAIAKIAERDNLNDDQIQRIVEEVNNQVYLIKYNKMKDSPDRDVEFDLASVQKVKDIVKTGASSKSAYNDVKEANESAGAIEKKASWEDEEGDKQDAWNSNAYQFSSLSTEVVRSKDSILAQKIADTVNEKEHLFKVASNKLAAETYTIAEAFIKYDRLGVDVQEVYEEMCKSAGIIKSDQILYKNAVEQKVAQMKEYNLLPSDYDLKIELCNSEKIANEFSLGKHSFLKEASEETQSNQKLPVVSTDRKVIKNINDLVSMAQDIQANKSDAQSKYKDYQSAKEKTANISMRDLEKVAQSGIAAFGKAILGVNKGKAAKELKGAAQHLEGILGNEKLVAAKNDVNKVQEAVKDINFHPRMSSVKSGVASAQDDLQRIRSSHDNVLNEAATQGPIKKMFNKDLKNANNEINGAKNNLSNAEKKQHAQKSRLQDELSSHVNQANNKVSDLSHELGVGHAEQKISDSKKAYEKATRATSRARTVATVGVGVPAAAIAINKKKKADAGAGAYSFQ